MCMGPSWTPRAHGQCLKQCMVQAGQAAAAEQGWSDEYESSDVSPLQRQPSDDTKGQGLSSKAPSLTPQDDILALGLRCTPGAGSLALPLTGRVTVEHALARARMPT